MGLLTKEQIRELIKEMLEAELDTELGYPKNGTIPEGSGNRRNGHGKKKVRSTFGEIDLNVPRDRFSKRRSVIKNALSGHTGCDAKMDR